MQRSILLFENAIKSDSTKKLYTYFFTRFLKWANLSVDSLLYQSDAQLQILLEDYLMYMRKRVSPNSLPPMFAAIELFFVMNSRVVQFKKIRKMFPEKIKKTGAIPWTTEDIQKMLDVAKSKRNKALVHFLASTGCRIGSLVDLKLKHVTDMSGGCKAVLFYEGSNEEYYSFLTPEASNSLNDYHEERRKQGERILPDSPVFSKVSQAGVSQRDVPDLSSLKSITWRLIQNSGTRGNRIHQRYDTQMDHGFRKRFNTILKSNDLANASLCEKLMGHNGVFALDGAYLKPTKEKLFEEFKKHIQNLTISDEDRDKATIAKLEAEKSELEKKNVEIKQLKEKQSSFEIELEKMKLWKETSERLQKVDNQNSV